MTKRYGGKRRSNCGGGCFSGEQPLSGAAEAEFLGPIGRDLQAVHGKVEVAPLQPRDQPLEIVLDQLDPPAQRFPSSRS